MAENICRQKLAALDNMELSVTDWEANFINSLFKQKYYSSKQKEVIDRMWEKYAGKKGGPKLAPIPEEFTADVQSELPMAPPPTGAPYEDIMFAAVLPAGMVKKVCRALDASGHRNLAFEVAQAALCTDEFKKDHARCRRAIERATEGEVDAIDNDGTIECDGLTATAVSPSREEGGVYVQCWVWVPDED